MQWLICLFLFSVTDMSPIIIDEENGIIYSPALKRSDYMAQRLKDMKDKRENLSPTGMRSCSWTGFWIDLKHFRTFEMTADWIKCHCFSASQMAESCSPVGLKPSLGSTPTVFKFKCKNTGCDLFSIDLRAVCLHMLSFTCQTVSP